MNAPRWRGRARRRVAPAAVLVGVWIVAAVLVDPRADVPLIDDWTYAMSVERLLAGRGFSVASWSSTFPPAQIFWGTLFAAVGGFSYTALRISTLVLAALGTLAFAALLRALGCSREHAFVGALTLAAYPVAFVLSFTFMTDVAMLTAMIASFWALAGGLQGVRGRVEIGLVLALVAFLVRPVAIAIPLALLATAALHPTTPRRARTLVLALVTLAAMAATTLIARRYWLGVEDGEGGLAYRLERLRYLLLVSPIIYGEAFLSMLAHLGLAVLPALLATAPPARRWPWRTMLVLIVAAIAVSAVAPQAVAALKPHATWSTQELGAARPLLVGDLPYGGMRRAFGLAATLVGLMAAAGLLARVARGIGAGGALRSPAGTCVAAFAALSLALCFALWFFYDRYYLPLVPAAIAIVLVAAPSLPKPAVRLRRALAGTLLAALFLLDVTGTRDMLDYARAVDAALVRLVGSGVAWREVDAGYVENGWHLYAHPEHLASGANVDRDVPHVTGAADLPYVIANAPLQGYALRETVPLASRWAVTDRVYVLARVP
ncbi:MAG: glycosyltransferase family 39 protein [Deltaproteobacteria bacterium]|nr:glycosyltransferase family 39 protein [Deltaproteobacteria bacterium]